MGIYRGEPDIGTNTTRLDLSKVQHNNGKCLLMVQNCASTYIYTSKKKNVHAAIYASYSFKKSCYEDKFY
jgi:hypothetical protein